MDFTQYDDAQLDQLRIQVLTEQERRQRVAQIPQQVADLARQFVDGGGDKQALTEAVDTATVEG